MSDQPNKEASGAANVTASSRREPYRPPVMTKLGTLRDLTMTVGGSGKFDGKASKRTGRGGRFDAAGRAF